MLPGHERNTPQRQGPISCLGCISRRGLAGIFRLGRRSSAFLSTVSECPPPLSPGEAAPDPCSACPWSGATPLPSSGTWRRLGPTGRRHPAANVWGGEAGRSLGGPPGLPPILWASGRLVGEGGGPRPGPTVLSHLPGGPAAGAGPCRGRLHVLRQGGVHAGRGVQPGGPPPVPHPGPARGISHHNLTFVSVLSHYYCNISNSILARRAVGRSSWPGGGGAPGSEVPRPVVAGGWLPALPLPATPRTTC